MQDGTRLVESFVYESGIEGPRFIVFGAIHGDEVCGPTAIRRVMGDIESGSLSLTKGALVCVPEANPEALKTRRRYIEENLNRIFRKTENPASYEERLANELCTLVDESDIMLDIHSSFAPGPVNLFVDYPTPENESFAKALNAEFSIYDWQKVYEENEDGFLSYTTDRYAYEAGKIGILFEAGQHEDPASVQVAYEAILTSLRHFGMLAGEPSTTDRVARRVHMDKVYGKHAEGDVFVGDWSHLQILPADTLVATRENGEEIRTTHESVILFPKTYAQPGGEWFYLGTLA